MSIPGSSQKVVIHILHASALEETLNEILSVHVEYQLIAVTANLTNTAYIAIFEDLSA